MSRRRGIALVAYVVLMASCGRSADKHLDAASGDANVRDADAGSDAAPPDELGAEGAADATFVDAPPDVGADRVDLDASPAPTDAATERAATDATGDVAATCGPVGAGTWFVDPVTGGDDAKHTGAAGCPFRSLTRALAAVRASRAGPDAGAGDVATIAIVNVTAVTLGADTGEVFPLTIPGNVTVEARDPTGPTPLIARDVLALDGIILSAGGWRLSHLALDCGGGQRRGVTAAGGGTLDHVSVQHCTGAAFTFSGPVTAGPAVVARSCGTGMYLSNSAVKLVGGRGAEHSALSQNKQFGVWLHGTSSFEVMGGDVVPATPDASDVDIADNEAGVYFDAGAETLTLRGAYLAGNQRGVWVAGGPATINVRDTFLANNTRSAVAFSLDATAASADAIDFGGPTASGGGHNVFAVAPGAAGANTEGAICVPALVYGPLRVLAAGNVFGTVDCAQGGQLTHATTCASQVDVAVAGPSSVDVGACTLRP